MTTLDISNRLSVLNLRNPGSDRLSFPLPWGHTIPPGHSPTTAPDSPSSSGNSGKPGALLHRDLSSDISLSLLSSNLHKPERELSTDEDLTSMFSNSTLVVVDSDLSKPGRRPHLNEDLPDMASDSTLAVVSPDLNKLDPRLMEGFPDTCNLIDVDEKATEGGGSGPRPLHLPGSTGRGNTSGAEDRVTIMASRSVRGAGLRMRNRNHEVVHEEEMARGLQPVSKEVHVQVRLRGLNNLFIVLLDGAVSVQHVQPARVMRSVFRRQKLFHAQSGRVLTFLQHMTSRSYVSVSPGTLRVVSFRDTTSEATTTTNTYCSSNEVTVSLHGSSRPREPLSSPSSELDLPMACLFIESRSGPHVCLQPALLPGKSLDFMDGQLMVAPGQRMAFQFQSAEEALKAFLVTSKMLKCFRAALVIVRWENVVSSS